MIDYLIQKINSTPLLRDTHEPSGCLAVSFIGHTCPRALWLKYRMAVSQSIDFRTSRIFERGLLEEVRIYALLKELRVTIVSEQVPCGDGIITGYADAIIKDIPLDDAGNTIPGDMVLEVKTANAANWKKISTAGGLFLGNFEHYVQVQFYMGLLGRDQALYICVNKNTEELYIEYLQFDREFFERKKFEVVQTITAVNPPEKKRIRNVCGYCQFSGVCWMGQEPQKNCRTCQKSSTGLLKGDWFCHLYKDEPEDLSLQEQLQACPDYNVVDRLFVK